VKKHNLKLGAAIVLNSLITLLQVSGGIISGSLSLISDALHNFSDVIALVISYIATILSYRKNTVHKTFGYKRAEIVAAFTNTLALISVALYLTTESFQRFYHPEPVSSVWVIALSGTAIFINGLSALILRRDASENLNIKSSYLHLVTDMFSSVAVLCGGVIMYYFSIYWVDGVLTLIIAGCLIYKSLILLSQTLKVLMLFTPSSIIIEDINRKICELPEVENIHHIHVWQLDDKQIHFEGHVDLSEDMPLKKVNDVLEQIRFVLRDRFKIEHVTLQPEYNICYEKDLVSGVH
jgi:cobalt-zinc-cadmium efflux system protein